MRKSLCFSTSNKADDVTIGEDDGAEVSQLVRIFILYQLSLKYNKNNIRLYRDNDLTVFRNESSPKAEKIKKHFQNIFGKK